MTIGIQNLDNTIIKKWKMKTTRARGLKGLTTASSSSTPDPSSTMALDDVQVANDGHEPGGNEGDDEESDVESLESDEDSDDEDLIHSCPNELAQLQVIDGELVSEPVNIDAEAQMLVHLLNASDALEDSDSEGD